MRFASQGDLYKSYKVLDLDLFFLQGRQYRLERLGTMVLTTPGQLEGMPEKHTEFPTRIYRETSEPCVRTIEIAYHEGQSRPVEIRYGNSLPPSNFSAQREPWIVDCDREMILVSMKLHDWRMTDGRDLTDTDKESERLFRKFARRLGIILTESRNLGCRNVKPGKYLAWADTGTWLARCYDGTESMFQRFTDAKEAVNFLTA